jgi:hypothetical protein
VEEEVNFPVGLSKKSNFLLDSAPQKSEKLPASAGGVRHFATFTRCPQGIARATCLVSGR